MIKSSYVFIRDISKFSVLGLKPILKQEKPIELYRDSHIYIYTKNPSI